jgi:hypothetical protein
MANKNILFLLSAVVSSAAVSGEAVSKVAVSAEQTAVAVAVTSPYEVMGPVCGFVLRADESVQVMPPKGKVLRNLKEKAPIPCGSLISTHAGVFWFENSDLVQFKFAPNSFAEIHAEDLVRYTLMRGQVMVEGAPQKKVFYISTPQSEIEFHGGIAWIESIPAEKKTQVASFNRKIWFRNRYNLEAEQEVNVGEMSSLSFNDTRVMPRQPVVMSVPIAHELLSKLKLTDTERADLADAVNRVHESKIKSLAVEMDEWRNIEKPQSEGRSLASEAKKDKKSVSKVLPIEVIQAKEAAFAVDLLRKKMMGEDDDQGMASVAPNDVQGDSVAHKNATKNGTKASVKASAKHNTKLPTEKVGADREPAMEHASVDESSFEKEQFERMKVEKQKVLRSLSSVPEESED